jgi:aminomethyltransferase
MSQIVVSGDAAAELLDAAVVSAIAPLALGQARYTLACNEAGGVIDDLIVYRLDEGEFLVIANAANSDAVAQHLGAVGSGLDVSVRVVTGERALLALQGPDAVHALALVSDAAVIDQARFTIFERAVAGRRVLVARTGYTGEDGFELAMQRDDGARVFWALLDSMPEKPVVPAGLAARDSLRLEAGLALYGHELSRERTPYEAGLGRCIDETKSFIGSEALRAKRQAPSAERLVGLVGRTQRVPRAGYAVVSKAGRPIGIVTSGGPSPTLGHPIAMAYVSREIQIGDEVGVDVRGRIEPADVVRLPFYRRGSTSLGTEMETRER